MKLTKYEHACFTLEKDGEILVVDPGAFTTDFVVPKHVIVVVITHEHADHFAPEKLKEIIKKNPHATIVGHDSIMMQINDLPTISVTAGDKIQIGTFTLEFFGGEHAKIHTEIPLPANLGVMIDDNLYYPGDSFALPEKPVKILALPVTAPWMKISEAIEFLRDIKPLLTFPTHDAIASKAGQRLSDRMIPPFAEKIGTEYRRLSSDEHLTI